jgi:hypothetical protein
MTRPAFAGPRCPPASSGWRPVLDGADAAAALDIARRVGRRLGDQQRVDEAVRLARGLAGESRLVHWRAEGLWQGYAGLALLSAALDRVEPDVGWDVVGREQIRSAAAGLEARTDRGAGFAVAVRGVAAAARALSRDGTRYRNLTATLDATLAELAVARAEAVADVAPHGVAVSTYDVIGGLTGVGRALLDSAISGDALAAVLGALVCLSVADADGVPHWYTPVRAMTGNFLPSAYPAGHVNLGLAHGIPGPLALLSLAEIAGAEAAGQREAIHRTADAIVNARLEDDWGVTFPIVAAIGDDAMTPTPGRNAWCYGAPGIARSLWLAGVAVSRDDLRDLAVDAMLAVGRRPPAARRIDSPTACHGVAGLLAITLRFAADTRRTEFACAARDLAGTLIDSFEPETAFGYRNLEPSGSRIDHPGLLDGAAGVALALVGAATAVEPVWDRVLLLS